MFKLMIIDDSPHIVQDLCQLIDWESFDFILTGSYTSAHRLLADAAKNMPDLVITDVSMPAMDGLKLSSELYKLNPDIKIIFISSYSEFEYAKRALELHIFDYLLKPVQIAQLTDVMSRLLKQLKDEERQRYKLLLEESQKDFYRKSALTHYLSHMLYHSGQETMIYTELQQLGLALPEAYHIYVASITPLLPTDSYIYFSQVRRVSDIQLFPLVTDTTCTTVLILYNSTKESIPIADFLANFCIDTETQLRTNLTIGYSSTASCFTNLPLLYKQSRQALTALSQMESGVPILSYDDIVTETADTANVTEVLPAYSQNVAAMRDYIHTNYMHDITTKQVAGAVYLSSNYANSLYISECGMTIFDYLSHYRIEKAKQLLAETDTLITRIAEMVGYGSKTSFYLAFKRQVGMSPTEYRQRYTRY